VLLGGVAGVVAGGLTCPVEFAPASTGGVAGNEVAGFVLAPVDGLFVLAEVSDEVLGVASGVERTSEPALVVADVLAAVPVSAWAADHQSCSPAASETPSGRR